MRVLHIAAQLCLWCLAAAAHAGPLQSPAAAVMPYAPAAARVVRVVDGDTLIVDIDTYPPVFGQAIPVRLAGCDTPELNDPDPRLRALAVAAREFVRQVLGDAPVELHDIGRGKYFRIIARVRVAGQDLSTLLLQAGLAVPYAGGKRPDHSVLLSAATAAP